LGQGIYSTAIGNKAGTSGQSDGAVAIGDRAGLTSQGSGAIAIGVNAGQTNQSANSIVISALGFPLNAPSVGTFIAPINSTLVTGNVLTSNAYSNEVTKSFIFSNVSGNVGIRTTTTTFELAVNGNISASRKLFIGGTNLTNNTNVSINCYVAGGAWKTDALSTWWVASDERLKENIETANITICYNTVKSLDLKRYSYKIPTIGSEDKMRLGWLAQEVQNAFPKSLTYLPQTLEDEDEMGDCLALNPDQIYACVYGATKKLIEKSEEKSSFSGTGTIATGSLSNVISVSGIYGASPTIQVTPIFNMNTGNRMLNVSLFDLESNSFTVYGGPGDFFWSVTL
jgi:hypothetical protein